MADSLDRKQLLGRLESVAAGAASGKNDNMTEQSTCVALRGAAFFTYNDEVACRCPSGLDRGITGAVPLEPLIKLLNRVTEEHVRVEAADGVLRVRSRRKVTELAMEAEILLPVDSPQVKPPKKWSPLPPDFCEAVGVVERCASRNEASFNFACVHLHPEFLEASDDRQFCRWRRATGVGRPSLVRRSSIRHIVRLAMTEVAETDEWVHFRNEQGLVYSCRRFDQEFPDFTKVIRDSEGGEPATLPKGFRDAVERARIFSSDTAGDDLVRVELAPGKIRVVGQGVRGRHREYDDSVVYGGPAVAFYVAPDTLVYLLDRYKEVTVNAGFVRADAGPYVYINCLDSEGGEEDSGGE